MADLTFFDALDELFDFRNSQDKLEDKLKKWARPPSQTETEKCERVVRMVKKAIDDDQKLSKMDITVFAKGSYANRTNIPSDSDVDVAILLNNLFYNIYPEGTTCTDFNFSLSSYGYENFKKDVAVAIVNYFGADQVSVGNKAIQVHSNSVRVDADVVPHFVHRHYKIDRTYKSNGVALKSKDGTLIYNWPEQDYSNGVKKNENTGKRYKAFTRILKNLRCEMKEKGYNTAENAASYLIACLAYNIPDYIFDEESNVKMTEDCLLFLKERTSDLNNVAVWSEVNEMKQLFGKHQGWKFDEVHSFLVEALIYFKSLKV